MNKAFSRFLEFIGYHESLHAREKSAYLIASIGTFFLAFYFLMIVLFTGNKFMAINTIVCFFLYLYVFRLMKAGRFYMAGILMLIAFIEQDSLLVFWLLPRDTLLYFYFFIIAPISFFIYDLEDSRERRTIIFFNALMVVLIFLSGLLPCSGVITLSAGAITFFRVISLLFTTVSIISVIFFYAFSLNRTNKELNTLVHTDPLTKVHNRRMMFEKGREIFNAAGHHGIFFSLMVLDIDFFKRINDTYGHPTGDKVLKDFSAVLTQSIRGGDILCRIGGEEFAIIMMNSLKTDLFALADKIRRTIAETPFRTLENQDISVTFSAGIAGFDAKRYSNFDKMLVSADKALYLAKESGRNRVILG